MDNHDIIHGRKRAAFGAAISAYAGDMRGAFVAKRLTVAGAGLAAISGAAKGWTAVVLAAVRGCNVLFVNVAKAADTPHVYPRGVTWQR
jgi:hypothetical protein